jgi:hypothetical protein
VKRAAILVAAAITTLAIVAALPSWKHLRLAILTPAELTLKQPNRQPSPPSEDCSEIQRTLALSSPPSGSSRRKPIKNRNPLSTDEIAIRRAVIQQWVSNERTALNVSARTFPFDVTSPSSGLSGCTCLKGLQVESLLGVSRSFHDLTPGVLPYKSMRLVDANKQAMIVGVNDPSRTIGRGKSVEDAVGDAFASGLFSMSEIAFDKAHRSALVSYSFSCGSLCGNGATFVFEKVGGEWKKTGHVCGGWVS